MAAQIAAPGATPAAAALRQELAARFLEAIVELKDDDREIITLRHFEQLSNAETAAELGMAVSATSKRYIRALRKLEAILSAQPADDDASAE